MWQKVLKKWHDLGLLSTLPFEIDVEVLKSGSGIFETFVKESVRGEYVTVDDTVKRVDVVWDEYRALSLKDGTREKRGSGERVIVAPNTNIPKGSWPSFLRASENKRELFELLGRSVLNIDIPEKIVISTVGSEVVCSRLQEDLNFLQPCNHEEADTRLILHVADGARKGLTRALIRTCDTDVLVLAVSYSDKIQDLKELWVSLGTGKSHKYVPAHSIAASLGPLQCRTLPVFHAFSGCDTVSSFNGIGKKTAFETWKVSPDANNGFLALMSGEIEEGLPHIEKFVVSMYDVTSSTENVNECRKHLFVRKNRQIEKLPPTQNALIQHCLRASYQSKIWCQSLVKMQDIPEPEQWGWTKDKESWIPFWTSQPAAQEALMVLIKCGCKTLCSVRCKCKNSNLPCTQMCSCNAECNVD